MGWGHGFGGSGLVALAVLWMTVIVTGTVLTALIFPARSRQHPPARRGPSEREVLDLKLARGDIDVETYRDLRLALGAAGRDRAAYRSPAR